MQKRRLAALAIAVVVAIIYVGVLGTLPDFGEVAGPAFATALLGLWTVGTVAFAQEKSCARSPQSSA